MWLYSNNLRELHKICSVSMKELYDNRDSDFIHHDQHTKEHPYEPELLYCYANTVVMKIKSSEYKNNGVEYKVFVLLEDFYTIARDKDIPLEEAVQYSILYGDVHVRCTCPAFLFFGYSFIGTELKYLYGLPRERRFPKIRNPKVRGTICKHTDKVIQWCLDHINDITLAFDTYYKRLRDGTKLVAVNSQGKEFEIGKKNEEGDVFFEQEKELEEDMKFLDNPNETSDEEIDDMEPDTWWDDEAEVIEDNGDE